MFVSEDTIKKIKSIHDDSRHHAALVMQAIQKAHAEERDVNAGVQQAFIRNAASAQITGAMLACIEAGIPLSEIRSIIGLDEIIEAENPAHQLDDFLGIEHLDFDAEGIETIESTEGDSTDADAEKE